MAQGRPRRSPSNSTSAMVQRLRNADGTVNPPSDRPLSVEERKIWDQFSSARVADDWRDMDLLLLAKIVRYEMKIRECQQEIDAEGVVIVNARGTPIKNPLVEIEDGYTRQQLAVIRTLSLGAGTSSPQVQKANAKVAQQDAEDVRKLRESGAANLLAV